jgi:4'-phosphopantetheinyl transferase EntD
MSPLPRPIRTAAFPAVGGDIRCLSAVTRSETLQAVFPEGVTAFELRGPFEADPSWLLPEERSALDNATPKRLREYTAGRLCARAALRALGVDGAPICRADDRMPMWPRDVTGSISHTEGYCAAALTRQHRISALGLDIEHANALESPLWPQVCTWEELEILSAAPSRTQEVATLMFSAKEAFYKCQYMQTRLFLDFADVQILSEDWLEARGSFRVRAARPLGLSLPAVQGRFCRHEGYVVTGAWHAR